jgi:hypothetical protein
MWKVFRVGSAGGGRGARERERVCVCERERQTGKQQTDKLTNSMTKTNRMPDKMTDRMAETHTLFNEMVQLTFQL